MSLLDTAIRKPVSVTVGAILLVLFGVLAALELPVQLTPNVDRPIISIRTTWEGASPKEVEREIIQEQEERLKSLQGLREMTATAVEGSGSIELEFNVGIDTTRALLDVSDKLRQVPSYPQDVDEPVVTAGPTQGASAIAWFILKRTENSPFAADELPLLRTMMVEKVKPRLMQAQGVATVGVLGGVESEIHIQVDPHKLAARRITLLDVRDAIQERNVDVSAGSLDQGKRSITVRMVGKFESLDEIRSLLLSRRGGNPVYLRDVATVRKGYKDAVRIVRALGEPAIAVNASRESGSNVLAVMAALKAKVFEVNRDFLMPQGLRLDQVYDQTIYIQSAIDLVLQNLWVGGFLAIVVLLLFLRSATSTLVVAIAIPISVLGAFLGLALLGRNLNVISLAGLAFSVGMVVDNSIVVMENIYRHRQMGKDRLRAATDGVSEVWGAVVASTLTTLAVFIPVVFVKEESGQLFADIAIAISAAVLLSFFVAVLFIPMATKKLVSTRGQEHGERARIPSLVSMGRRFTSSVVGIVAWLNRNTVRRLSTVFSLTGAAILLSWLMLPPMTYLPDGSQNLIIGFVTPPPGLNSKEFHRIGQQIEAGLSPYWSVDKTKDLAPELRRPAWYKGPGEIPAIENFFYVSTGRGVFMGMRSVDATNVRPLIQLMQHASSKVPGIFVHCLQRSLFERGLTSGNTIGLEISGHDMETIKIAALALKERMIQRLGSPRAEPANFHLGAPEQRVRLDQSRAAELGLSVRDVGFMLRAMVDGAIVDEFREEGVNLDIKLLPILRHDGFLERLSDIPLFTPAGRQVPLSAVASIEEGVAATDIRHRNELRAVKLNVKPPDGMELSLAMDILRDEIIAPLREAGVIPPSVNTYLAGPADKLVAAKDAMKWNFLLAILITYLLLSALFESFIYPIVVMVSVPLAAVGGIFGLRVMHAFTGQQMDVLTMLGFVILLGTVVNNAILIVHQALNYIRDESQDPSQAILESVRTRVRPIFMSTLTSVLGMLPLIFFPGAGSELYRGLGSVVVGGLIASTIFTLFVVPTLFSLFMSLFGNLSGRASGSVEVSAESMPAVEGEAETLPAGGGLA